MESDNSSPSAELGDIKVKIDASRQLLEGREWSGAIALLQEIIKSDPVNPTPYDLLARAFEGAGQNEQAADVRAQAKSIRDEQWKRTVEAEIRGRHELVGNAVKRDLP